jgi:hypothetical protein
MRRVTPVATIGLNPATRVPNASIDDIRHPRRRGLLPAETKVNFTRSPWISIEHRDSQWPYAVGLEPISMISKRIKSSQCFVHSAKRVGSSDSINWKHPLPPSRASYQCNSIRMASFDLGCEILHMLLPRSPA